MSYLSYLREYFFPSGCGGCGEALPGLEDAWFGLCVDCRAYLSAAIGVEKHCGICGRPLISEKETCLSCRQNGVNGHCSEGFIKLRAIFPYTGRFRAILGAYKFGKSLSLGNFLVQCLILASKDLTALCDPKTIQEAVWVPVPPRPGKKKSQGWDQIEYLAALLKREYKRSRYNMPVYRCLKRLPSRSQKELNREERRWNHKGRILCTKPPPRTAILFDDVITTGATLNACAEALMAKGSAKVYGVCLFYD
jgi:ComF family protein